MTSSGDPGRSTGAPPAGGPPAERSSDAGPDDVGPDDAASPEAGFSGEGLAARSSATPEEVVALYDSWADGYDDDLDRWGYDAPERVASIVVARVGDGREVLDAGCGTGRAGAALARAGCAPIGGGDVSAASLDVARRRDVYAELDLLDLDGALSFADDRFAAAVSVGVFTYVADTAATLRELCRVVEPGGVVVLTQRDDLWDERGTGATLAELAEEGTCSVEASDPVPYLPGHPEFGDDIGIRIATLTVR